MIIQISVIIRRLFKLLFQKYFIFSIEYPLSSNKYPVKNKKNGTPSLPIANKLSAKSLMCSPPTQLPLVTDRWFLSHALKSHKWSQKHVQNQSPYFSLFSPFCFSFSVLKRYYPSKKYLLSNKTDTILYTLLPVAPVQNIRCQEYLFMNLILHYLKIISLNYSRNSIRTDNCTMNPKIDPCSLNIAQAISKNDIKSLWQSSERLLSCQGSLIVAIPTVHSAYRYWKVSHRIHS